MNIVEVISDKGVRSTSKESRLSTPKPGDVVEFESKEYPFNSAPFGRISGNDGFCNDEEVSICCGGASVFLCENGDVSISGGPFETVKTKDLEPTFELKAVRFWNWGDNRPGADQGVNYYIDRPVFKLKA